MKKDKIFLLLISFFALINLISAQGVTVTSVSTSSVITKDTSPSNIEWIINTQFTGGGQSIAGTIDSSTMKSFLGKDSPYPKNALSIQASAVEEKAIYSVDNENIGIYYYDISEWYECPKFLGLCKSNPPTCSKSPTFEVKDFADGNPLADYEFRYCIYKERVGTKGVFNNPTTKFEADISLSVGGDTQQETISSDQSSVNFGNVATATWTGNLVTGEALPTNINNYVAIKELSSNMWKIVRESTYDDYDDTEPIADNNLNNLDDTSWSDDIEYYEIENAVSGVNYASNIVMSSDASYSENYFSEFNEDTGNFIVTLDRSLGNPNIVFRVKASWIGIVIPVGEPSIISLNSESFGSGETGNIEVEVKNIGDVEGTFSAKLVDCQPFNVISTSATTRVTLSPEEIGKMIITLDAGSTSDDISQDCKIEVYDVNDPSIMTISSVNVAMTTAKVCTPGKISVEGNLIKKCNDEGSRLKTIEKCNNGIGYDEEIGYFCTSTKEEGESNSIAEEQVEGFCELDKQCNEIQYCNTQINRCVDKSGCLNVINNGDSNDKADFLFIGAEFSDLEELKNTISELLDFNGDTKYPGLFSVEPFKSNKDKFNIWMIKAPDYSVSGSNTCSTSCSKAIDFSQDSIYSSQCPNADFTITIFKEANFRSCAGGGQWNSLSCQEPSDRGKLILHETGHSFGRLADEYEEPSKGSRPRAPNCADTLTEAQQLWGDLVGIKEVDFFEGCSYTEDNYRPTKNSLMRSSYSATSYGPVNERAIKKIIDRYK